MALALFHSKFWEEDASSEATVAVAVGTRPKFKRPPKWGEKVFDEPLRLPKKKKIKPEHVEVMPERGAVTVTGFVPIVEVTEHITVSPAPAVETFTGYAPTAQIDMNEEYLIRAAFALLDY